MNSYIVIEKKYSEKKQRAYLLSYICFNDTKFLINLPNEVIAILLKLNMFDLMNLQVGYVSKKIPLDLNTKED